MSKYSNHLNIGLFWYLNGRFVSGCQMVWYSNGGLKTGQKKPVYDPKCQVFEWSTKSHDNHLNTRHPHCTVSRWLLYMSFMYVQRFLVVMCKEGLGSFINDAMQRGGRGVGIFVT